MLSLIKDNFNTEEINKILSDNFFELKLLEKEFKANKITFIEFLRRLVDKLD
ncbi:unnamed protein product [marine sediment metagenome]|uniref:Uncharacterized protein n=1 Tax=marine sediment metagenome TaxID=412755 RepID=X1P773_9ZZZZ